MCVCVSMCVRMYVCTCVCNDLLRSRKDGIILKSKNCPIRTLHENILQEWPWIAPKNRQSHPSQDSGPLHDVCKHLIRPMYPSPRPSVKSLGPMFNQQKYKEKPQTSFMHIPSISGWTVLVMAINTCLFMGCSHESVPDPSRIFTWKAAAMLAWFSLDTSLTKVS